MKPLIEFRPGVFARHDERRDGCTFDARTGKWLKQHEASPPVPAWLRSLPVGQTSNHMRNRPRSSGWPGEHNA
jgi:hypothetical protein